MQGLFRRDKAAAIARLAVGDTMLKWGAILGAIGFLGGFVGPIIITPEANQGPLLGIFITGPLGFLIGLVVGLVLKLWPHRY